MRYILLLIFLIAGGNALQSQNIYGYWEGVIQETDGESKIGIHFEKGSRRDPVLLNCRVCKRIKGTIIDQREPEKLIDFYGIINRDESVNLVDKKLVLKQKYEEETRTRYQFVIEIDNGVPRIVGYWQDYNAKGRKVKQGRFYLTKVKQVVPKV